MDLEKQVIEQVFKLHDLKSDSLSETEIDNAMRFLRGVAYCLRMQKSGVNVLDYGESMIELFKKEQNDV